MLDWTMLHEAQTPLAGFQVASDLTLTFGLM